MTWLGRHESAWPIAARIADVLAILLLAAAGLLLIRQAGYFPEINPDEAGAFLGLQLLHGRFAFPLDPDGPGYIRYYFLDCYPPVYYLFNALVFQVAGFGIVQARGVTIAFLIAAGGLSYAVVRRGIGVSAGLFTLALFIGLIPTRVYYWIVNRPDVAAHFFTLVTLALLLPPLLPKARKAGFAWGLAVGCAFGLATQSHYIALLSGPLIGFLVLWRARWQPWISPFAYGALLGLVGSWLPFLWAAWPYRDTILGGLLGYGDTIPVIERFAVHLRVLTTNFTWLIYGVAPLALGLAVMGTLAPKVRSGGDSAPFCWSLAFLAAFGAVSFYSNNSLVWYYGLTYFIAGLILVGLTAGTWIPHARSLGALAFSSVLALLSITYLAIRVERLVTVSHGVRVTTSFDVLNDTSRWIFGPTVAPIHFVFSAAGERVLDPRVVVNQGTGFAIVPSLAAAVPELPPLDDYRAAIIDHGRDVYDAQALLWHARAWRQGKEPHPLATVGGASLMASRRFVQRTVMTDPGHGSGNWSLWTEGGGEPGVWPEMILATPGGPKLLTPVASCPHQIMSSVDLSQTAGPIPLWRLRLKISFPGNLPIALKALLAPGAGQTSPPLGLLVYYPSQAEAEQGWDALSTQGRYPFLTADAQHRIATIAPTHGDDAEVTTVLLPSQTGGSGIVDLISIEPAILKGLTIADVSGQGCASPSVF